MNQQLVRQRLAPALILWLVVTTGGSSTAQGDWPMFGRDATRNSVSPGTDPPVWWDVQSGRNIKWQAAIGQHAWAQPVVADGLIWIGTDNQVPRDPEVTGLAGILMCFRESDGEFLYQHVSPARQGPGYWQAHTGTAGSPLIEGDRLWFVSTRSEVICLDIGPLHHSEGLPIELWKLDMLDELGVIPRRAMMGGGNLCSIGPSHGDLIFVSTGNGTHDNAVPAPLAPALVCLNKHTGEVVWQDNSPGSNIIFAEWGNPSVIEIDGRAQVIAPQGDGWVRSFDALTGELIWKFDINPKDGKWPRSGGFFSTAPVFHRDRVYIAIGNYIEFGELPGRLVCLDPTRAGDISLELDEGPDRGQPNPNSGVVWHFDGMGRTMSSVAIKDGLVIAPDLAGYVHCLDADTGQLYWTHDLRSLTMSSPLIVEDRIYMADEDGDVCILELSKEKRVIAEHLMNALVASSPIHANGVLYLPSNGTLHAIGSTGSGGWPEWRGPGRANVSDESGLLQEWPEEGPPLLWTVSGLGTGIASVSVAGGQIFTTGYHAESEFAYALDAGSGEARWALRIGPTVRESSLMRWLSQRAPTVDGDRVYVSSAGGDLFCLATGIEGRAALTAADGHLFLRGANGLMVLAEAIPVGYVEKGSFLIPDREEAQGVTSPVVTDGCLYLRDNDRLLCYDVAADALARPRPEPRFTAVSPALLEGEVDRSIGVGPRVGRDRAPDAIYVPTPQDVVERMLELAAVKPEEMVYDLGSGDGRIVITAAEKYGARAVGYEIDPRLVELSRQAIAEQQLESLARIEHEDIFTLDLSGADVIAVYLPSPLLERLLPQFEKLPPGVRIVSHQFPILGSRHDQTINLHSEETGDQHRLFLWTTPLRRAF